MLRANTNWLQNFAHWHPSHSYILVHTLYNWRLTKLIFKHKSTLHKLSFLSSSFQECWELQGCLMFGGCLITDWGWMYSAGSVYRCVHDTVQYCWYRGGCMGGGRKSWWNWSPLTLPSMSEDYWRCGLSPFYSNQLHGITNYK